VQVVRVFGLTLILIDCDDDYAAHWNRWYDLDHIPEFLALPGVVAARRYLASSELLAARPPSAIAGLGPGLARYCTLVMVGPDAAAAAIGREGMAAVHNRLIDVEGRMPDWSRITPRYIDGFDLVAATAGSGMPVSVDALAHLAHRGVLIELRSDNVADRASGQSGVLAHLEFRISALPGVDAPWDEEPANASARPDRLDLYLLDRDPAEIARSSTARFISAPDASVVFQGLFRTIDALQYGN
jgi:hypothetical protein